jgi:hypothetical protein
MVQSALLVPVAGGVLPAGEEHAVMPWLTRRATRRAAQSAKAELKPVRAAQSAGTVGASRQGKILTPVQPGSAQTVHSAQAEMAQHADLAADLIAAGVTTQLSTR